MPRHRHNFHALYWHLGPFGRQDIHLHPCGDGCEWELVAKGRDCDPGTPHYRKRLTEDAEWKRPGAVLSGSAVSRKRGADPRAHVGPES